MGVYAVLDQTAPRYLALPMLGVGVVAALAGLVSAGRRVERTRYRPDRWRWPELVVAGSGVAAGAVAWYVGRHDVFVAHPGVTVVPQVSTLALVGLLLPLAGGLCAPPPAAPFVGATTAAPVEAAA